MSDVFEVDDGEVERPDEWYEVDDVTITDDQISRWKYQKLGTPPNVSLGRWNQPKVLSERHYAIVNLTVMGQTHEQIAKEVALSTMRVGQLLSSPLFKKMVAEKREKYYGEGRGHMKALLNKSFGVIESILDDEDVKAPVRLDAAKYVIDQVIGKAQQNIKVEGTLLMDLMSKLDARDIEATQTKQLAAPVDEFDTMIDDIIVERVVVGQRVPNPTTATTEVTTEGMDEKE